MVKVFLFASAMSLAALSANVAFACKCLPPTEGSVLASSDIAIEGRVLKTESTGSRDVGRNYFTIRVTRVLKGRVPRTIRVESRKSSAACGVRFERGQKVRFGANVLGRNYSTGSCSQF